MRSQVKKNFSAMVIADVMAKLPPLLTFPYLTRVLGPELYGKYGFAKNVAFFLTLLASTGLYPYGIRAVAQNSGDENAINSKIIGIRLVFTAAAIAILLLYTFTLSPADELIRMLLLISGLLMIPSALNLDWLLIGRGLVVPVAVATIIGQLLYAVLVVLFVKSKSTVWMIPASTLAGEIVCVSIIYYVVWKRFGLAWPRFTKTDFKEIVPVSFLLGLGSIIAMSYDKIDSIILGYFRPIAEVGVYMATYKIIWIIMSFQPVLATVFFPLIAESTVSDRDTVRDSQLYLKILYFITFPLIAGGIVLAEPFTRFVIGSEYTGAGLLFTFLLPNIFAGGLANYYAGIKLVAMNKNREYVIAVSAGAATNIVLNLIFVPRWGAMAAAVVTCLSQFSVAGIAAWFGREHQSPSLWQNILKPLTISIVMVVVLGGIVAFYPEVHVLFLIFIGAAIYFSLWKTNLGLQIGN